VSDPLRILVAADVPEDPDSGAAGSEYQGVRALRTLGHHVEALWAADLPRRLRHPNLHAVFELPGTYLRALSRASSMGYDVYQFNQVFAHAAARAHKRRRLAGVFVMRSHGHEARALETLRSWHLRLGVPRRRWARRLPGLAIDHLIGRACASSARWSDGSLVSSIEDREFIIERYGVPPHRVACIPQAPPPEYHVRPSAHFGADRARRLLFIGPLTVWKGTHVLRAVLPTLLARHPEATVTLVLPESDGREGRALIPLPWRERVTVLGSTPQGELMDIYDTHGILLFPSLFEGFGKVVVEAMSRGVCVVGSRLGSARLTIQDGVNGRVVTAGDEAEFERAVDALIGEPGRVIDMGGRARETVRHLTWASFGEQAVSFFRSLLELRNDS
jgi:glycosyltransferase involved in cell wall biosynthesis